MKPIAYCGLACCLCSENEDCVGCQDGGCEVHAWCKNYNCCREKGISGCWECLDFPCSGNMLDKLRIRAFAEFVRRYGVDELERCLQKNKANGIVYHYDDQLVGDYDQYQSVDEIIHMIRNGHTGTPKSGNCLGRMSEGEDQMTKDIEIHIAENLSGEAKQTAMDFVGYLKTRGLAFFRDSCDCWKDKIYYWVKQNEECVCFIAIKDPDEPDNLWTIWSDDSSAYEDASLSDGIKNVGWRHIDHCGNCGSCGGGREKVIFGKSFPRVCACIFRIDNATQEDLPFLKTMVDLRMRELQKS